MSNSFNPVLDAYSKGKIDTVNFDMDYDQISVAIQSNEHIEPVEVIFEDVKAFYYIDHDVVSTLDISTDNLNAIAYDISGFGEFTAIGNRYSDEQYVSMPNFAVSVKDSSLYIDANKIRILNKSYQVR